MPQSLAQIYLHVVFSTKDRQRTLTDFALRDELHRLLGGLCNTLECPVLKVGGVDDHVHLGCRLGRTLSVAELVKELKRESTLWLRKKSSALSDFRWQAGYGAFSISPSHVAGLIEYIQNQEEHHKKESFQDELRRVLKNYGLEWDERYVWD